MWVDKPLKFVLFVVFTFGVSHSVPNATQRNLQSERNDITTVLSTTSSSRKTTFWTEQATFPTYPTSANSVSSSSGQSNAHNTITTTSAPSTLTRCATTLGNSKTKLVIAGFYSDSSGQWDGSGLRSAANLALKHVNENPNILKKYELDIKWKDSRCQAADGVWAFHSHLVEEPKKIMLLGPTCSPDAEPVAQTSQRGNLVTVSYSAASPQLSNKERHPYFFRTYKTDIILNGPRIWLFKEFQWERIGSIHENTDLFTLTHDHLYDLLGEDIDVLVKEIFDGTPKTHQIKKMKNADIKIILVSAYEAAARDLFCEAFKGGLYGKDYVWILLGWYNFDWYHEGTSNCTKEEVETIVEESLYISMEAANFSETPDVMTVSGYTAREIKRQLENECWEENANATGLEMFGYDALWAIALGLNQTDEQLASQQYQKGCLEDFNYNSSDLAARSLGSLLFEKMNAISFEGASGYVDLPFGDRHGVVNIEQLQPYCNEGWHRSNFSCYKFVNETRNWIDSRQYCKNLTPERHSHLVSILSQNESTFLETKFKGSWYIGLTHNKSSGKLFWVDKKNEVVWWPESFNSMEKDSSCYIWNADTRTWESSTCNKPMHFICKRRADFKEQVIYTLYSNDTGVSDINKKGDFIWHGEVPTDRTQAKEVGLQRGAYRVLSMCAYLGIILAISFLTFNILARNHRNLKLSSPNMNNLIVIGCILIYISICILGMEVVDPNEVRVPVRAFCMLRLWLMSIGFVLGFGAIFCKIWRVYKVANFKSGPRRVVIKDSKLFGIVGILLLPDVLLLSLWTIIDPLEPESYEIDLYNYILHCNCKFFNAWAILLGAYKGLILVIGVFLAWETRNVEISALNDSKSIGLCIYTTTLLCVIGIATAFPFPNVPGYQYIVTSTCMLFCVTFVLLVVFVPKIRNIHKSPKFDRKSSTTSLHSSVSARIQSTSTIDIEGTDNNNGNTVIERFSSFWKQFSFPWKQSFNVDQTKATNNSTARNPARSTDDVFV
ncbi:Gamma-aminobutyric acid type B receptor subunit 1 [Holothuria leucospilota]|uniref:Gamma-aminobutyric acid type B receptor subunit 2 n=1 Tax=Holothuria leucospilota TaxID=206669 RepID=A0A9Q1CGY7_HOLLE|nr:Gamma-aminobutyric acid type B receptor subunit 1 [Holothuria leucospilota]